MRSIRAADEKWPLLACTYKRYSRLLFLISNDLLSVQSTAFLKKFNSCVLLKMPHDQTESKTAKIVSNQRKARDF